MPLTMTKGEINRLGKRLIAADTPAEADLEELALIWAAYQEVLETAKTDLGNLGYSPTGRVKTTQTMLDKLRRPHPPGEHSGGMELSRMQDLAGARIVIPTVTDQDEAKERICGFYEAKGCPWRVVDRRADPRYGYRAVHVIVTLDGMPVEIQVRTELQDSWAQIVERLADSWGRDIRYGEDPEDPDRLVRSGDRLVGSRRDALALLMRLSDTIANFESLRASVEGLQGTMARLGGMWHIPKRDLRGPTHRKARRQLRRKIPVSDQELRARTAASVERSGIDLSDDERQLLALGDEITGRQLLGLSALANRAWIREIADMRPGMGEQEDSLRGILQLIAEARDEET